METKQTADSEEKKLKQRLLNEEKSPCVCCRLWSKSSIEGWQPREEQKATKKRLDTSRGGNQGSLRRERTIVASSRGDFLFRHYESIDRYIQQYRENHASTCMGRDFQDGVQPVLGVDVPDPYLPKIASSSFLIERIKIIEALSSYYSTERDVQDICLTGTKANESNSNAKLSPLKKNDKTLPQIENNRKNINKDDSNSNSNTYSSTNAQVIGLLPTVNEKDENTLPPEEIAQKYTKECSKDTVVSLTERLKRQHEVRDIIRVTNGNADKIKPVEICSKSKKESLILPAAKLVCNENEKLQNSNHLKTIFPQISFLAGDDLPKQNKSGGVLETLRIGKKVKISKETNTTEDLCDEILNLRSLETRDGLNSSGGNLCLGKTVRPSMNQKEQNKKVQRKKFPSDNTLQQLSRTVKNSPRETTFIRILGQPKGPQVLKESNMATTKLEQSEASDKIKERQSVSKDYSGIPLSYLRRFGRRNFHHVLEARSYKPETRKVGTTVIPN